MQSHRPPNLTGPRVPTPAPANSRVSVKKRKRRRSISPTSRVPADLRKGKEEKLPPDIIYDILTRLPVKSLSRFRITTRRACNDDHFLIQHPTQAPVNLKKEVFLNKQSILLQADNKFQQITVNKRLLQSANM